MKFTRLFAKENGDSAFESLSLKMNPLIDDVLTSDTLDVKGLAYIQFPANSVQELHNAPMRQWIIHLSGVIEVEVSDGEKRQFEPGDCTFAEDTTGKGHITRILSDEPASIAVIPIS